MEIALQRVSILTEKPARYLSDYTDCIINGKMASQVHCCFAYFLFFHIIIFLIVSYEVIRFITSVFLPSVCFKNSRVVHACSSISCFERQQTNYFFF